MRELEPLSEGGRADDEQLWRNVQSVLTTLDALIPAGTEPPIPSHVDALGWEHLAELIGNVRRSSDSLDPQRKVVDAWAEWRLAVTEYGDGQMGRACTVALAAHQAYRLCAAYPKNERLKGAFRDACMALGSKWNVKYQPDLEELRKACRTRTRLRVSWQWLDPEHAEQSKRRREARKVAKSVLSQAMEMHP